MDELRYVSNHRDRLGANSMGRVKTLLVELSARFKHSQAWDPTIEDLHMFPGGSPVSLHRYCKLIVPDRRDLRTAFESKLPWHELSEGEVRKLRPLLAAADGSQPESLFLSQRVAEELVHSGHRKKCDRYQKLIRVRATYIVW